MPVYYDTGIPVTYGLHLTRRHFCLDGCEVVYVFRLQGGGNQVACRNLRTNEYIYPCCRRLTQLSTVPTGTKLEIVEAEWPPKVPKPPPIASEGQVQRIRKRLARISKALDSQTISAEEAEKILVLLQQAHANLSASAMLYQ